MSRNWKHVVPRSTLEALRLCKDYAKDRHNLSVERIADRMGISADLLYKWLSNGQMHASLIQTYEHICGAHFVSDHLAHSQNKLAVSIPSGRDLRDDDMLQMHQSFSDAMALLAGYYSGKASSDATLAALTAHMEATAWHRANVMTHINPQLELGNE